jgi:hypothetical protein
MAKQPNLAKRLEAIRDTPPLPVSLTVALQAPVYRTLEAAAAEQGMSVEDFVVTMINRYAEESRRDPGEVL